MQTRPFPADFVVRAPDWETAAMVEVRNYEDLTPEVAAEIRSGLFTHGLVPKRAAYFLMVSQEYGHLWQGPDAVTEELRLPNLSFSTEPLVRRYLRSFDDGERIRHSGFDMAVSWWLRELSAGILDATTEPEATLAPTGFLAAMRHGKILEDLDD